MGKPVIEALLIARNDRLARPLLDHALRDRDSSRGDCRGARQLAPRPAADGRVDQRRGDTSFFGILLILLFAVVLGWLPSGGYVDIGDDPIEHFKYMLADL